MKTAWLLPTVRFLGLTGFARATKKRLQRMSLWPSGDWSYSHRRQAYSMLSGRGLEIGALHCPAAVPKKCRMEYCDAHSREDAAKLFREIEPSSLVVVDHIVNLDKDRLADIVAGPYDFVIMNHVIEHVANPVSVFEQMFSVIKQGGSLIISAPDKHYTFDKNRPLSSFEHLLDEYRRGVDEVDDSHYMDFISHVHPEIMGMGDEKIRATLESVRSRREHAHVWDSDSFAQFLTLALEHLGIRAELLFISKADQNKIECFVMMKKS